MIREAGQWKRGYLKLKIWGYGVERFLNVGGIAEIGIGYPYAIVCIKFKG